MIELETRVECVYVRAAKARQSEIIGKQALWCMLSELAEILLWPLIT